MNQKIKLNIGMALLYLIILVSFGLIIINEKSDYLIMPKFKEYINTNYKEISHTLVYTNLKKENKDYYLIIENKNNKNLNFKITYSNNKFNTTYEEDYIKGNSIITHLEKKHSNNDYELTINKNLNEYTKEIQNKIITDNFLDLEIYQINKKLYFNNFEVEEITNQLKNSIENNLNPSGYNFTITNNNNLVQSIKINNLTKELLNSPYFYLVITDIINNNNNSNILKDNNITYEYLN